MFLPVQSPLFFDPPTFHFPLPFQTNTSIPHSFLYNSSNSFISSFTSSFSTFSFSAILRIRFCTASIFSSDTRFRSSSVA